MATNRSEGRSGGLLLLILVLAALGAITLVVWSGGPLGSNPWEGDSSQPMAGESEGAVARPTVATSEPESDRASAWDGSDLSVQAGLQSDLRLAHENARVADTGSSFKHEVAVLGVVRSAFDLSPLADVLVRFQMPNASGGGGLQQVEGRTDEEGEFELTWGKDLPVDITLLAQGFGEARLPSVNLEEFLELQLSPAASIGGLVLGARSVLGKSGSDDVSQLRPMVLAWRANTSSKRLWERIEVPLSEDATFLFEDLEVGEYVLSANLPGLSTQLLAGQKVGPGEHLDVQLEAVPGATLSGRVLQASLEKDGESEPLAGVTVTLQTFASGMPPNAIDGEGRTAISDADGAFAFGGLGPGKCELRATFPGGNRLRRTVVMPTSRESLVTDLVLDVGGSLGGILLDANGKPVRGVELVVFPERDRLRWRELVDWSFASEVALAATDGGGAFRFDDVPTGAPLTLALHPTVDGSFGGAARTLLIPAMEPGEQRLKERLVLAPEVSLGGRVVDEGGAGIAGAIVAYFHETGEAKSKGGSLLGLARCDDSGTFTVHGLQAKVVKLTASATGFFGDSEIVSLERGAVQVTLELGSALGLAGVALDEDGVAIAGLPVRIAIDNETPSPEQYKGRRRSHNAVTDSFGRFQFEGLFEAEWNVDGGSFQWELIERQPEYPRPGQDEWVELTFAPRDRRDRFTIRGKVEGLDGRPPGALSIKGLKGGVIEFDQGRFIASGLTPTRQRFTIFADGYRRQDVGPVDPRPGGEVNIGRIVLEDSCSVSVLVQNPEKRPIENATVFLAPLPVDEGGPLDQAQIKLFHKARGRYVGSETEQANYRVVVRVEGLGNKREVIDLTGKQSYQHRISF
ncbi:MAG: hypothetical protein ACI82F_002318 [Planctomycetota bacterium]|jgi:hypothetical protein